MAFFFVSSVAHAELYFVKERRCIFKIHIHDGKDIKNTEPTSPTSSKPTDLQRQLAQLDRDLKVERDVSSGALKMFQKYSPSHSVYSSLKEKLEASNKRVTDLEEERRILMEQMEALGIGTTSQTSEAGMAPELIEKWKNVLSEKLSSLKGSKEGSDNDERVREVSRQLRILEKGPLDAQALVVETLEEGGDGTYFNYKGHRFRLFSQKGNTDRREVHGCQICHDALWMFSEIVKCNDCTLISHKHCYKQSQLSCQTFQTLRSTKPLYFLAPSEGEQRRWVAVLERLRRDCERSPVGLLTPDSPTVPGNDIEAIISPITPTTPNR
ncbi:hypothetical protein M427DRAFT_350238 [Gonapodya prolifera JEL478]|uniref:Phorbol-ester/DAG-type domain-containing protein n=1 Tax=Gonapodya prolifera (strain JEL478) TaxID=1344416 RepID=A0A139AW81_GONPJ|nr:hypothetical protein M427DRAFT_350238 [Gonapodya prolifera JEL478]|eukprot:KXS21001.1 hypothetical protein M427DRAFT_350238 [Gonapodya prolifera JEL478]